MPDDENLIRFGWYNPVKKKANLLLYFTTVHIAVKNAFLLSIKMISQLLMNLLIIWRNVFAPQQNHKKASAI